MFLIVGGITAAAMLLPSEGGYELIPGDDYNRQDEE